MLSVSNSWVSSLRSVLQSLDHSRNEHEWRRLLSTAISDPFSWDSHCKIHLERRFHWVFTPSKRPKRRSLAGPDKVLKTTSTWTLQFKTIKHSRAYAQDRRSEATRPYANKYGDYAARELSAALPANPRTSRTDAAVTSKNQRPELSLRTPNLTYNCESAERKPSWTDLVNSTARELNPPKQHSERTAKEHWTRHTHFRYHDSWLQTAHELSWFKTKLMYPGICKDQDWHWELPTIVLQLRTTQNGNPSWTDSMISDAWRPHPPVRRTRPHSNWPLPRTPNKTHQKRNDADATWNQKRTAQNSPNVTSTTEKTPASLQVPDVMKVHTQQTLSLHQSSQQRSWNLHASCVKYERRPYKSGSTSLHPADIVDRTTFSDASFLAKRTALHNSSAPGTRPFSCKITEKLSLTRLPELWSDQKHNCTQKFGGTSRQQQDETPSRQVEACNIK